MGAKRVRKTQNRDVSCLAVYRRDKRAFRRGRRYARRAVPNLRLVTRRKERARNRNRRDTAAVSRKFRCVRPERKLRAERDSAHRDRRYDRRNRGRVAAQKDVRKRRVVSLLRAYDLCGIQNDF